MDMLNAYTNYLRSAFASNKYYGLGWSVYLRNIPESILDKKEFLGNGRKIYDSTVGLY